MAELVVHRLHAAMNAHDVDAFVDCFHELYASEQPAHPDRVFQGSEQVRANWTAIFEAAPDFRAELVRAAAAGGLEWSEWHSLGTHADGTTLDMAGVIVFGVRGGRAPGHALRRAGRARWGRDPGGRTSHDGRRVSCGAR